MFTGIVEEVGIITRITKDRFSTITIKASKVLIDTKIGDSICVNGVCLTVTRLSDDYFCVDVMPETYKASNLAMLANGSKVNLERALTLRSRLGGHFVTGHIDGVGNISKKQIVGNSTIITITAEKDTLLYIIKKGSVALDGISLTVVDATEKDFMVSIIPQTSMETTILEKEIGQSINIETDMLGRYVGKLIGITDNQDDKKASISKDLLRINGFL